MGLLDFLQGFLTEEEQRASGLLPDQPQSDLLSYLQGVSSTPEITPPTEPAPAVQGTPPAGGDYVPPIIDQPQISPEPARSMPEASLQFDEQTGLAIPPIADAPLTPADHRGTAIQKPGEPFVTPEFAMEAGSLVETYGEALNEAKNIVLDVGRDHVRSRREKEKILQDKGVGFKTHMFIEGLEDAILRMPEEDRAKQQGILEKIQYKAGGITGRIGEFALIRKALPALPVPEKLWFIGNWASNMYKSTATIGASMLIDELAAEDPSLERYRQRFKGSTPYILAFGIAPYISGVDPNKIGPEGITLMQQLLGRGYKMTTGGAIATAESLRQGNSFKDALIDGITAAGMLALTSGATMQTIGKQVITPKDSPDEIIRKLETSTKPTSKPSLPEVQIGKSEIPINLQTKKTVTTPAAKSGGKTPAATVDQPSTEAASSPIKKPKRAGTPKPMTETAKHVKGIIAKNTAIYIPESVWSDYKELASKHPFMFTKNPVNKHGNKNTSLDEVADMMGLSENELIESLLMDNPLGKTTLTEYEEGYAKFLEENPVKLITEEIKTYSDEDISLFLEDPIEVLDSLATQYNKEYGINITGEDIRNEIREISEARNLSIQEPSLDRIPQEQVRDNLEAPAESYEEYSKRVAERETRDKKLQEFQRELDRKYGAEGKELLDQPSMFGSEVVNEGATIDLFDQKQKVEALSSRSWQNELARERETDQKINKTQILKTIEKDFGVLVRDKATHRWRQAMAGGYYPKQLIVRMRKGRYGELEVLAHEVAHHIDRLLMKEQKLWKAPSHAISKELKKLDYDPGKQRLNEGFAEYFRHYMTTGKAEELAPEFHKHFNDVIKKNPVLEKKISNLKAMYETWDKMGAEERILSQMDTRGEHTSKTLAERADKILKRIPTEFIDAWDPLRRAVKKITADTGKPLMPTKDPYKIARYSNMRAKSIAETMVLEKMINEKGDVIGKGLLEILQPVGAEDMESFISYAVAQHANDLHSKNKETGLDVDDVRHIIKKYQNKTWDKATSELKEWSDHLIDWLVRAGGLSAQEGRAVKEAHPFYVPLKRIIIDEIERTGSGRHLDRGSSVKRLKGSTRPYINPIQSLISMANQMVGMSQKIRIAAALADLADLPGAAHWIHELPAPMDAIRLSPAQVTQIVEELTGEMIDGDVTDEFMTLFANSSNYKGAEKNHVFIYKDGKRRFYWINPEIHAAFSELDTPKLGSVMKVANKAARMLRLGAVTFKASFMIRNPWRDAFHYAIISQQDFPTPLGPLKGHIKNLFFSKQGTLAWRYKSVGGEMATLMGNDRISAMNVYDKLLSEMMGKKGKGINIVRHPVSFVQSITGWSETGTRIAELEGMYKKLLKEHPDWPEEDVWVESFIASIDLQDYSRAGKAGRQINSFRAFWNSIMQSADVLGRRLKERPGRTALRGILWIAVPAIYQWYRNKDKDWYNNLDLTYKYSNLFYEMPSGEVLVLPLPFHSGVMFGSSSIAAMDRMYHDDPKATEAFGRMIAQEFEQIYLPFPTITVPVMQVAANKDWRGRPIESAGMKFQHPTKRTHRHTTEFAKKASQMLDSTGLGRLSPVQIDHLITGYTGGVLNQIPRTDMQQMSDVAVLGAFFLRSPERPRRQAEEFFERYTLLQQKKASDIASPEELRELSRLSGNYRRVIDLIRNAGTARDNNNREEEKRLNKQLAALLNTTMNGR